MASKYVTAVEISAAMLESEADALVESLGFNVLYKGEKSVLTTPSDTDYMILNGVQYASTTGRRIYKQEAYSSTIGETCKPYTYHIASIAAAIEPNMYAVQFTTMHENSQCTNNMYIDGVCAYTTPEWFEPVMYGERVRLIIDNTFVYVQCYDTVYCNIQPLGNGRICRQPVAYLGRVMDINPASPLLQHNDEIVFNSKQVAHMDYQGIDR